LKILALDIKAGDRILAYCNNQMQVCTVKRVLEPEESGVTLSVSTSKHYRNSTSSILRFREDALLESTSEVAKEVEAVEEVEMEENPTSLLVES
jgi:hypothetical protein